MKRDRLGIAVVSVFVIGVVLVVAICSATGCSVRTMRYLSGERNIQDAEPRDRVELRRHTEVSDDR